MVQRRERSEVPKADIEPEEAHLPIARCGRIFAPCACEKISAIFMPSVLGGRDDSI
jgi:hypothetical protein